MANTKIKKLEKKVRSRRHPTYVILEIEELIQEYDKEIEKLKVEVLKWQDKVIKVQNERNDLIQGKKLLCLDVIELKQQLEEKDKQSNKLSEIIKELRDSYKGRRVLELEKQLADSDKINKLLNQNNAELQRQLEAEKLERSTADHKLFACEKQLSQSVSKEKIIYILDMLKNWNCQNNKETRNVIDTIRLRIVEIASLTNEELLSLSNKEEK